MATLVEVWTTTIRFPSVRGESVANECRWHWTCIAGVSGCHASDKLIRLYRSNAPVSDAFRTHRELARRLHTSRVAQTVPITYATFSHFVGKVGDEASVMVGKGQGRGMGMECPRRGGRGRHYKGARPLCLGNRTTESLQPRASVFSEE